MKELIAVGIEVYDALAKGVLKTRRSRRCSPANGPDIETDLKHMEEVLMRSDSFMQIGLFTATAEG